MKKNLLAIALLYCTSAWALYNHPSTYDPATSTIDKAHASVEICTGDASPTFTTSNKGDYYNWYKYNETTKKYVYTISTSGNSNTFSQPGKYLCDITTEGNTASTGNMLALGGFEFDNTSEYKRKNVEFNDPITGKTCYLEYQLDNLNLNGQANSGEYCTSTNPQLIKPQYFSSITAKEGNRMLVVDGATNSGAFPVFHVRNLKLKGGQTYEFSCWAANIDAEYYTKNHGSNSLPQIKFEIEYETRSEGKVKKTLGDGYMVLTDVLGDWGEPYKATFTPSEDLDWAHITIYNTTNTTIAGNDFVIDGIYFGADRQTGPTTKLETFEYSATTCSSNETINYEPCKGSSITLTAKNTASGNTYVWNTGETSSSITINAATDATYTCTVTAGSTIYNETHIVTTKDCTDEHTATICFGDNITLEPTVKGDSYLWTLPDGSTQTTPTLTVSMSQAQTATYTCQVYAKANTVGAPILRNNIITNGDFEDTALNNNQYNGFSSDYNCIGATQSFPQKTQGQAHSGAYLIGKESLLNSTTYPTPFKAANGNYFLECDGGEANSLAYIAPLTTPLQKGTEYQFAYSACSNANQFPAELVFKIAFNGKEEELISSKTINHNTWKQYGVGIYWKAPEDCTDASIKLYNDCTEPIGNDFAIDMIMFQPVYRGTYTTDALLSTETFHVTAMQCEESSKDIKTPSAGDIFDWNGQTIYESGLYINESVDENNVTHTDTLIVVFQPTINDSVCQHNAYTEHGFSLSSNQTATVGMLNDSITVKSKATGCEQVDSTTTLHLQVFPTYLHQFSDTIQKGEVYTLNGFNIDTKNMAGGLHKKTLDLQTVACACDSIVQLELTIITPIVPMQFFSPNDDNLNDLWHVEGLDGYPMSYVCIYDRHHRLLTTIKGSEYKGWDGNYNGHPMPMDDYWYVITVPETNQQISGHFCLKR